MRKAVFFDAGMTLLLPAHSIPEVYLREARALGVRVDESAFREHMNASWQRVLAGTRHDPDDEHASSDEIERALWWHFTHKVAEPFRPLADLHEAWLVRLLDHFDATAAWRPAEGAVSTLTQLRARGVKVGVLSNWHSSLHGILDGLDLRRHLDFVIVSADVGRRKPHLEIFTRALKAAGVAPEEALHVGDSWHDDVLGARRAGIASLLIRGGSSPDRLPEAGAESVPHFAAAADLILGG